MEKERDKEEKIGNEERREESKKGKRRTINKRKIKG